MPTYNGDTASFDDDKPTGWINYKEQDKFLAYNTKISRLTQTHDEILYFYPTRDYYEVHFTIVDNGDGIGIEFSNTSGWTGNSFYYKRVPIGETITLPGADEMTQTGYTFSHWELNEFEDNSAIDKTDNTIKPYYAVLNNDTIPFHGPGYGGELDIALVFIQNQP